MKQVLPILRLVRPKQWSKNLLVFAALIFTRSFHDPHLVTLAILAFVTMCLASSATYAINDAFDAEKDRLHPTKSKRPIASGEVSVRAAYVLAFVLLSAALGIAAYVKMAVVYGVAFYLAMQLAYNLWFKHVPIADVFVISTGFVLRAAVGSTAINVKISAWLLLCTAALSLLLGFGKRRHEFLAQGERRGETRASLVAYSRTALDALVIFAACAAGLCYGIYVIESPTGKDHPALILTSIFVVYGICRYLLVVFSSDDAGEPETLLFKDRHIFASIVLFLTFAVIAMVTTAVPFIE